MLEQQKLRDQEYCNQTGTPPPHESFSGVLRGHVQLSLGDVNSFGCHVWAGGHHSSQRREGHGRVEEAGLGGPRPFRGGHQRLEKRGATVIQHADKREACC